MAKRLVFMPDYAADPLWDDETGAMVSLDRLPVGTALRERVRSWARRWDELADDSMLGAEEDEEAWTPLREEQLALWRALQDGLRGRYEVGLEVSPPGRTTVARRLPSAPDHRTSIPKPVSTGQIVSLSGRIGPSAARVTSRVSASARTGSSPAHRASRCGTIPGHWMGGMHG